MHRPTSAAVAVRSALGRTGGRGRIALLLAVAALVAALGTALAAASDASPARGQRPHPGGGITATVTSRWAARMLEVLNAERARHGLRPLHRGRRLTESAHRHDLAMARANSMAHQLPGEPYFATRISSTGYRWRAAGENIGWSRTVTRHGVVQLQHAMYHERPPADGHRVNILSREFAAVGIDVLYDRVHHKIWFTQDFGRR